VVTNNALPAETHVKLTAFDNTGGSGLWGHGIRTSVVTSGVNIESVFNANCGVVSPAYAPFPNTGFGI
jgi:hypothetical protein